MKRFSAIAPAKINLSLHVSRKNETDEKHAVETILQTITLHDTLNVSVPENEKDTQEVINKRNRKINDAYGIKESTAQIIKCENIEVCIVVDDLTGQNIKIPISENLVQKAFIACAKKANFKDEMHIEVLLEKNIPVQAGLGGGSSDAAAALIISKELFDLSDEDITEVAKELGSDVVFFLKGGCALMSGDGSIFSKELRSKKMPMVLVRPEAGISTAEAYQKFDELDLPGSTYVATSTQEEMCLHNDLQPVAREMCPAVTDVLKLLSEAVGEDNTLLCGSGSTCFAICKSFEQSRKIASVAQENGYWTRACSCVNMRATIKKEF